MHRVLHETDLKMAANLDIVVDSEGFMCDKEGRKVKIVLESEGVECENNEDGCEIVEVQLGEKKPLSSFERISKAMASIDAELPDSGDEFTEKIVMRTPKKKSGRPKVSI